MGHVYVTVSGYGKRIVPASSPCELAIAADESLTVTLTATRPFPVRRIPHESAIDSREGSERIADVVEGPARAEWWLDTTVYCVPLPRRWTAIVTGDVAPAFYLVQKPDRAVFVQTARSRPTLDELVAPGQRLIERGGDEYADWVEVSYVHERSAWRQRQTLLRGPMIAMVTAQAPVEAFAEARQVQIELVRRAVFATMPER